MMFLDARWQDRGYLLLQVLPSAAVVGRRRRAHYTSLSISCDLELTMSPEQAIMMVSDPTIVSIIDHACYQPDVIALPIQLPT